MMQKKTVDVVIGQQKLSLKTEGNPDHVLKVVEFVNKKLAEIQPATQPLSQQVLLLLAMNMAEELLRIKEGSSKFRAQVQDKSKGILKELEAHFPF